MDPNEVEVSDLPERVQRRVREMLAEVRRAERKREFQQRDKIRLKHQRDITELMSTVTERTH